MVSGNSGAHRRMVEKKSVALATANGTPVNRLGLGTWHLGDSPAKATAEIAAIRRGICGGLSMIDTAEMYGSGNAEKLVGQAIGPFARESLYLIDKVLPANAGNAAFFTSLHRSLRLLNTSYLDLYLLHWRGQIPLSETVALMEQAKKQGLIRDWGVSNFDVSDMEDLMEVSGGTDCCLDQCLYHLGSRGVEYALLPWLEKHGMAFMAYCPLAQAGRLQHGLVTAPLVAAIAAKYQLTPFQLLLAFTLRKPYVYSIPKAGSIAHVDLNLKAAQAEIDPADWAKLDQAFPAPIRKLPLDVE